MSEVNQAPLDKRVEELRRKGLTYEKIASALNMDRSTVAERCRELGLGGRRPPTLRPAYYEVLRRVGLGEDSTQIARGMGTDASCTASRIRAIGVLGYIVCVDRHTVPKKWMITEAGRAALAAHRRQQ